MLHHVRFFVILMDCSPARLLCPWNSPGRSTVSGCHFLFWGSSQPRDWTCISWSHCIGRQILDHWATWEALELYNQRQIYLCEVKFVVYLIKFLWGLSKLIFVKHSENQTVPSQPSIQSNYFYECYCILPLLKICFQIFVSLILVKVQFGFKHF